MHSQLEPCPENVGLHMHSPIRLRGLVSELSTGEVVGLGRGPLSLVTYSRGAT
jgi:hypothetical protein